MSLDVALNWNLAAGRADMAMAGPDLSTDAGLETAILVSLFSDRLAEPGDAIPDGSADRRGWWGDLPTDAASAAQAADRIGSRLWLLDRALQTSETLARAETYAREALAWMTAAGVAGSVAAAAAFPQLGWITLKITVEQAGASRSFAVTWQNNPST